MLTAGSHIPVLLAELQPRILFALKRQADGRRRSELHKRGSGPGSSPTAGDAASGFYYLVPKIL